MLHYKTHWGPPKTYRGSRLLSNFQNILEIIAAKPRNVCLRSHFTTPKVIAQTLGLVSIDEFFFAFASTPSSCAVNGRCLRWLI